MIAIETITASTDPQTVAMNPLAIELHNAISRRIQLQNDRQPCRGRRKLTADRPVDFDKDAIQQRSKFQTWRTLAVGVKFKYGGREFIKGRGNDEERLMRFLSRSFTVYSCKIEGCPKQRCTDGGGMCRQCFRKITGKTAPKQKKRRCLIDGCPKLLQSHCEGMCRQCFKDTTGESAPSPKCLIDGCPKLLQSHCQGMCKQCFKNHQKDSTEE